jgi:hypothetical protein
LAFAPIVSGRKLSFGSEAISQADSDVASSLARLPAPE